MPRPSRRVFKRFFYSNTFLFLLLVLVVFVGVIGVRVWRENKRVDDEIARLEREAENLKNERLQTLELLRYVRSSDFIEDEARETFNLAKPGESMMLLSTSSLARTETASATERLTNPERWRRVFFD